MVGGAGLVAALPILMNLLHLSRQCFRANGNFLRLTTYLTTAWLAPLASVQASGILADGVSARAQALGGAGVTGTGGSLEALADNPAALGLSARPRLELGGNLGWVHGEFHNRANDHAELHDFGAVPAGALSARWGPLAIGLGVVPDVALRADWRYRDTPGGLDGATTYGERSHLSEITLIRFALGASYAITPQLAIGAGVGLLYNRNRLQSPYIIQTQPQLAGAKTLLDLETDGWGWNGQFGLLWQPLTNLRLAVNYTLPSRIRSKGHATSDAGRQLANLGLTGVDATADFDAEVTNHFPQMVSAGVAWRCIPRLELVAQVDWIDWSSAFDTLEVRLRDVNNPLYRALLAGGRDLNDDIPLDWRDQWVVRLGAEYQLTEDFAARLGYRYARSAVPTATLTPLTAAIPEHVLTAGLGYRHGPFTCDLAYQYHLPQRERVGTSRLLTGEYSDSEVEVSMHWVGLTVGVEF